MIRKFTKELDDLYVRKGLSLLEALRILGHKSEKKRKEESAAVMGSGGGAGDKISRTSMYLYYQLETGNLLSNAFRSCPYINFDELYVSFISLAEATGDLKSAISFLNDKYERKHKNKMKLIEVSVYPLFVITVSIGACAMLLAYSENQNIFMLIKYVSILLGCCGLIFFGITRLISENKLYESFLAIDFLIKAGVGMAGAMEFAIQILGVSTKLGKIFEDAKEKLEYGMNLQNALKLGSRFEEGFYFADKAGGKTDVFEKMALWVYEKDEQKRKICMSLIEPLFILIAGVFLLTLIMKFFLPFINDFNWI